MTTAVDAAGAVVAGGLDAAFSRTEGVLMRTKGREEGEERGAGLVAQAGHCVKAAGGWEVRGVEMSTGREVQHPSPQNSAALTSKLYLPSNVWTSSLTHLPATERFSAYTDAHAASRCLEGV